MNVEKAVTDSIRSAGPDGVCVLSARYVRGPARIAASACGLATAVSAARPHAAAMLYIAIRPRAAMPPPVSRGRGVRRVTFCPEDQIITSEGYCKSIKMAMKRLHEPCDALRAVSSAT